MCAEASAGSLLSAARLRTSVFALALLSALLGCGRADREEPLDAAAGTPPTGSLHPATHMSDPTDGPSEVGNDQSRPVAKANRLPEGSRLPRPAPTIGPSTLEGTLSPSVAAAVVHPLLMPAARAAPLAVSCDCLSLFCPERIKLCGRLWLPSIAGLHGSEIVYSASLASLPLPQFEPRRFPG